jgi:hypothetical protein
MIQSFDHPELAELALSADRAYAMIEGSGILAAPGEGGRGRSSPGN